MTSKSNEALKNKFDQILMLRAKANKTSYKEEYLKMTKELRERARQSMLDNMKKVNEMLSKKEANLNEILTTKDYEIDPNKDLDQQIGVILEGEMYDQGLCMPPENISPNKRTLLTNKSKK